MTFEKQHGNRDTIDKVILNKRRFEYDEKIKENEHNYDVWFDYCKLEEQNKNAHRIRETYERAISARPPINDKSVWKRYIYLFIKYAIYEELKTKNYKRVRQIYKLCLHQVIPHDLFTFGKIWILYAEFEIRRKNLEKAKLILGRGVGQTQKKNVIKRYIKILISLKEVDNCRKLYEQWLKIYPEDTQGWIQYVTLENNLMDFKRARAILNLAVNQEILDFPEKIWKMSIDFEIEQKQYEKARLLYERLLERTSHVRVWISFAQFECSIEKIKNARKIFQRADKYLKTDAIHENANDERVVLLEAWLEFEEEFGTEKERKLIEEKQPKKVRKERPVFNTEGVEVGAEEYYDFLFPEDDKQSGNINLLRMAQKWKKHQLESGDQ